MARDDDISYLRDRLDALSNDMATTMSRVDALEDMMATKVSVEAFTPIKLIVYGLISTMVVGVLKTVMSLSYVIK